MSDRGQLDFGPLLAALKKINYSRWTEIFMHPLRTSKLNPRTATFPNMKNDYNVAVDFSAKLLYEIDA